MLPSKQAAEDFKILMQASSPLMTAIQLNRLDGLDFGTEGFGLVAEGLQSHPSLLESAYISKSKGKGRGKKEDLRIVWDALRPNGFLVVKVGILEERLEKDGGEAAWTRLCQISISCFQVVSK